MRQEMTLSIDQMRSIARDAYIFAYPLVMNYRTMYMQAIRDDPELGDKGDHEFGKWLHLGTSSPDDKDIVTPNNDTPYSYAWVDLRAEPWVLTMPSIEKERYYTSQWDDLWGYVLDNPGSVNDGNDGGSYLLVSPSWKGKKPKDIKRVIRGESDILGTLTRTQTFGGEGDMDKVVAIQDGYTLQPLSSFLKTEPPAVAAPAIDWPEWIEGDETSMKFFGYVNFLLSFTTPHPDDKKMYKEMAMLGIEAGAPWEPSKLDPQVRQAMEDGIVDAQDKLKEESEKSYDPANFFNTRKEIGTDYLNRALGVYVGIFGNTSDQAVYFTEGNDINGEPTDGNKHSYTVTFEAGKLPPVKYFWSYTMYCLPERLLVENELQRYSIGSSTKGLKRNEDGSLTIYFSVKSPEEDKKSNWLPAHDGPFWAVLRTYGPKDEILKGTWKQPPFTPEK